VPGCRRCGVDQKTDSPAPSRAAHGRSGLQILKYVASKEICLCRLYISDSCIGCRTNIMTLHGFYSMRQPLRLTFKQLPIGSPVAEEAAGEQKTKKKVWDCGNFSRSLMQWVEHSLSVYRQFGEFGRCVVSKRTPVD
jgi:hypothetical protein